MMKLLLATAALLSLGGMAQAADLVGDKSAGDTFSARWNAVFNQVPVAEWRVWEADGPLSYKGPFMVAVDPYGIITRSPIPLTLYPDDWHAMAQGEIEHACPQPTAQLDKGECQ